MVLAASGQSRAYALREAFEAVKRVLEALGMKLNKTKCVVVSNTGACRQKYWRAWLRVGVDVTFSAHDLGVDVQWGPWKNPVQQSRVKPFSDAMILVQNAKDGNLNGTTFVSSSIVRNTQATAVSN
eukprot:1526441-Amphidinium_carterae.1